MEVKECSKCNIYLPMFEFYSNDAYRDGYYPVCKECHRDWFKEYTKRIKENGPHIHKDAKVCAKCKDKKPISQFGVRRSSPDGHMSYCKPCWRAISYKAKKKK